MRRILQLTCTADAFENIFTDVFTPNEPIIGLWKRLREQGVKLVAASNVEELRHAKLKEMGIHDLFDRHCLSHQVRSIKPERAFFDEVVRQAYISPEEILFVDDHPEFVEVAKGMLLQGLSYDLNDHAAFEKALEGFTFERYQR
jgi:HAD superfamily hydrolase (TIGR01509 family)